MCIRRRSQRAVQSIAAAAAAADAAAVAIYNRFAWRQLQRLLNADDLPSGPYTLAVNVQRYITAVLQSSLCV